MVSPNVISQGHCLHCVFIQCAWPAPLAQAPIQTRILELLFLTKTSATCRPSLSAIEMNLVSSVLQSLLFCSGKSLASIVSPGFEWKGERETD